MGIETLTLLFPFTPEMSSWSNGLCQCCAQPGGCGLCARAALCPCTVMGDINTHVGGPGAFVGGCCLCLLGCGPCMMCFDAPQVAQRSGKDESAVKACLCSCCPLTSCCYSMQVYLECRTHPSQGVGMPMQNEMK